MLRGDKIELGPGQLTVVGFGRYASGEYDLGLQEDVRIPVAILPVAANFVAEGKNTIKTSVAAPEHGDLRIIVQQRGIDARIQRSSGGAPPNGTTMGKILVLHAWQNGQPVPIEINYDKAIWSGLSWAAGEIKRSALMPGQPVRIECLSTEKDSVVMDGHVFVVEY